VSELVSFEKQGSVGVITVNNPPVNALAQGVRQGLIEGLARGIDDPGVSAMVIIGGGRTFIAGADIREFGKPPQPPDLHSVLEKIESSPKPVVAAIHGTALGGGLEVCLACHYRVAVAAGQVGLPEVKLGLLPGAGGTQRLPRLIGAEAALKMIVSGDPVRAPRAKELGIVDEVVGEDLRAGAVAFAEALFETFKKGIEREARGYLAPFKCIEAVQAAVTLPFAEGLKRERQLFQECMASPQSKGQIHAFFAEREATKIPDVPPGTPARKIERAAVIGAGTMGGGIAMNFANAGIPVTVVEMSQEALDRGLAVVKKNYAGTVEKGRLSQADMDKRMGLITGTLDRGAIREADIVIEAVFEEMAVKKDVFAALDKIATSCDSSSSCAGPGPPRRPSPPRPSCPGASGRSGCSRATATASSATACSRPISARPSSSWKRAPRPSRSTRSSMTSASPWVPSPCRTWRGSTWAGASARARRPRAGRTCATHMSATGSASRGASARRREAGGTATSPARGLPGPIPKSRH